ncbi:MAG: hypothetical protein VZR11_09150 [Succinimonas sp.]|nr:hypothetical protein [Succinimonas sp.]
MNGFEFRPEDKDLDFLRPREKADKMESLHKELEAAKERLKQVKADVRRQEKPAGFFGKLNSGLVNSERIAEARHQVRMAKMKIELEKQKIKTAKAKAIAEKLHAETEKLKSGSKDRGESLFNASESLWK